jgi:hypothetical protein
LTTQLTASVIMLALIGGSVEGRQYSKTPPVGTLTLSVSYNGWQLVQNFWF